MIGILTEKPSAGRNFAKALGGMTGTYNGEQYMIVSARGHLYEFADPEKQVHPSLADQYKSWDLKFLPWNESDIAWKREKKKDTVSLLKDLKTSLGRCDEIVIATDVDPTGEGELLAWEILDELKLKPKKFSRMYFLDEAPKSIQKAFVDRKILPSMQDDPDYVKAQFRSQFDYLTMQFTRIASKCGDGRLILRQGRLKSAMVLIVGDGLAAVANYKKIPFYQNRFRDENGVVYTNPKEPQFPDKNDVPKNYHASAVVVDSKSFKTTAPPKLIDLAGLSSRLASKGIKAKKVLDVYQKMYEAQVVSYPRTEDACITPEQFNELAPLVDKIASVVGVDIKHLTHRLPRKTHVKTGGAHGANRPGLNVPSSLSEVRTKYGFEGEAIYDLLARSYLAMLAEDYEYEHQEGHVKDYPLFVGSTNIPKKMGWKVVFSTDNDNDDDVSDGKPLGLVANPFVYEGFPPKPAKPTMKWLMKQLEKYDVGTGATRTSTYADVTNEKSKYPLLIEKKGVLSMAPCGEMSYKLLPGTCIGDLKLTEQLQADMRAIADGKFNPNVALSRVAEMVKADMKTMQANSVKMRKELNIMSDFKEKEYCEGSWNGQAIRFNRNYCGHRFTDEECEKLLAGESIEVHGLKSKSGSTYGVIGKLDNQVFNGRPFVGFARTGFAQSNDVPSVWCNHTFTDDEKAKLKAGDKISIKDAVSKKTGKTFSCSLTYGKRDDGTMGIIPSFD